MLNRNKVMQIRQFRKDAKSGNIVQLPRSFLVNFMQALDEAVMRIPDNDPCETCKDCQARACKVVENARKVLKGYV